MTNPCRWCGMHHGSLCPSVKAIEYHENGTIKRVEFKTANDYPLQPAESKRVMTGDDGG